MTSVRRASARINSASRPVVASRVAAKTKAEAVGLSCTWNWNRNGFTRRTSHPISVIHPGFSGVYFHGMFPDRHHPDVPIMYKFGCTQDIAKRLTEHASAVHSGGQLNVLFAICSADHYGLESHGKRYLSTCHQEQWNGERTCVCDGNVPRKELYEVDDVDAFREHMLAFAGAQEVSLEELGISLSVIGQHLAQLVRQCQCAEQPSFRVVPGAKAVEKEEHRLRRAHFAGGVSLDDVLYLTKHGAPRLNPKHAFSFVKQNGKSVKYNLSDLRYDMKIGTVCIEATGPPYDGQDDTQAVTKPAPATRIRKASTSTPCPASAPSDDKQTDQQDKQNSLGNAHADEHPTGTN